MRYGWARTAAVLAMAAALAACGRDGASAGDPQAAENLREAEFFMTSNARAEGIQTLPSGVQYKVLHARRQGLHALGSRVRGHEELSLAQVFGGLRIPDRSAVAAARGQGRRHGQHRRRPSPSVAHNLPLPVRV